MINRKWLTATLSGIAIATMAASPVYAGNKPAGALGAAPAVATPAAPTEATDSYTVAVDTKMRAMPAADAAAVRGLRAATTLIPTGQKAGLFVEVTDTYGTKGWVSVEDLR